MNAEALAREALEVRADARELASADAVGAALDRLAIELTAAVGDACPVLVAVMQGGVFTATELARRLDFPHEFDYVHLTRYGAALAGGEVEWLVRPRASLRGRDVVIVDDIHDRGDTIAALQAELAKLGVARQFTAVLVEKDLAQPRPRSAVDFVGLRIEDRYVFGCGMDYKGFWRGLPALYAVD
jgi:hypoxanthine phosphoribosyltransferase